MGAFYPKILGKMLGKMFEPKSMPKSMPKSTPIPRLISGKNSENCWVILKTSVGQRGLLGRNDSVPDWKIYDFGREQVSRFV